MRSVQIPTTDVMVGMRVRIHAKSVKPKGWITFTDHRVVDIQLYDDGRLYMFILEPWDFVGPRHTIEVFNILEILLFSASRTKPSKGFV